MNLNKSRQISINFKGQRSLGFTLLEIVIVMGLIFFLTGAFVLTLRRSGNTNQLRDAAQELQSEIRGAKNDAMSGKVYPAWAAVPKAVGVWFYNNSAYNNQYWILRWNGNEDGTTPPASEIKYLPSGITLRGYDGTTTEAERHIIYSVPTGNAFITSLDPRFNKAACWNQQPEGVTIPSGCPYRIYCNPPTYTATNIVITLQNTNGFRIDITVDCNSGAVNVGNVYQ